MYIDRQTSRRKDGQTDRRTDGQTDRQTDKEYLYSAVKRLKSVSAVDTETCIGHTSRILVFLPFAFNPFNASCSKLMLFEGSSAILV